jgi:hypothetical protein
MLLRHSDRSPFLKLRVDLEYAVIFSPGDAGRLQYRAAVTRYVYRVLDLDDQELFAFHWHPVGVSDVRTPHLHVSAARAVSLARQSGSPGLDELNLGKLHFPTHRIGVGELVRFLITELGVRPRRPDWESVLERNQH